MGPKTMGMEDSDVKRNRWVNSWRNTTGSNAIPRSLALEPRPPHVAFSQNRRPSLHLIIARPPITSATIGSTNHGKLTQLNSFAPIS